MGRRHPNHRLVRIHRNYTVEEAARLLGTHKNTIRAWIKQGLSPIDRKKPQLIHGLELSRFLQNRRQMSKQTCPPGHLYCVRCKAPRAAALDMADYIPSTATTGNLRGICPACGTLIHRRVSWAKLDQVSGNLEITIVEA
jgi:Helix-turn-helix domain